MKISNNGVNFIKQWESFRPTEYFCEAGKRTIGYGHVILGDDHPKVLEVWENRKNKGTGISENFANILLQKDLEPVELVLRYRVKVELTQNQYDALCSLIFNVGAPSFYQCKGFRYLGAAEYDKAAREFFDKTIGFVRIDGRISQGLVNRRLAENQLWSSVA